MCTGSGFRDTGSGFKNGKYNFVYDVVHDANIGSPCRGDQGTSLMVKENERCCNEVYARNSLQNCIHCRRYTVAGVFSKCLISKWTDNCCMDPVVYEKINGEIKHWIWTTAKGVRESRGCPKKELISMDFMYITTTSYLMF